MYRFLIIFVLFTGYTFSQWFQTPSGVANDLNGVFCLNSDYGFIAGSAGTFLKTTDGGTTWNAATINPLEDYNDLYFFDQNTGIMVGNGGVILRTTNGGTSWNPVNSNVTDNLYSISFNGMNGIIGGSSQTILYSTDGGASWNTSQTGFFGGGFNSAYNLTSSVGFVAGQNSIFQPFVGKSTDGGVSWEFYNFYFNSNEGYVSSIHFFDESSGIVTGVVWNGMGAISRTTNGGTDWLTTLFLNPINNMVFTSPTTGYAVGDFGYIIKSTNSGLSWNEQTSGTTSYLRDVDFFDDGINGVAVGEAGLILTTTNGGIPVELASFTGKVSNSTVLLEWMTASEKNNRGFYVERKINDEWKSLSFINGKGTTTEEQFYSYTDDLKNLNYSGIIYYRLKQVDFDGTYEYSPEIEIDYNSLPDNFVLYQNYPNPFNPVTTIKYSLPVTEKVSIKIYNILGNEVKTLVDEVKQPGTYEITFDATGLSSGIYIYEMRAGKFTSAKYLTLLK